MTGQVQNRERTASRLLDSSARNSFDPDVDIDWESALDPDMPYAPFERVSLYGTPLWERLSHRQRVELSKHEVASIASVGLWFEVILMQVLARYIYDRNPRTSHAQYALTEIGDETRHSLMFAKMTAKFGTPSYRPARMVHELGRIFTMVAGGPSMFAGVLVAEETLDRLQRESMDDPQIQPLVRMVNRIHVVEEARHVRFAREELARQVPKLSKPALAVHQHMTAVVAYFVMDSLIQPTVYASVGLDPVRARKVARANPHYLRTRQWMGEKIIGYLDEVGMISSRERVWWRRAALIR
ncbi:AurF N-oxygenase family protein [Fodinicola feengrottensis]|uniref:Diiron oxygenase n=1 Tax=Fodinicola feengrottensis TaxID=435914 RepID=A0ABN2HZS3_9ACTN|nr:diiron oxygenase [Fodinicola feengrottensis]